MKPFPKRPLCEVCGKEPATMFAYFGRRAGTASQGQQWRFAGMCAVESASYPIELDRFFHAPASTVDWLAHLHEKGWMDWPDFMDMMDRFREATGSYNQT